MVKDDSGLADRGASADLGGQGPSRTGVALPRLEYFDGNGCLCASDGDGVGREIAWDGTDTTTPEEMREIARRCNAHDALLAALRVYVERTTRGSGSQNPDHCTHEAYVTLNELEAARAAIARATS